MACPPSPPTDDPVPIGPPPAGPLPPGLLPPGLLPNDLLADWAADILGAPVRGLAPITRSGNNRLYRVTADGHPYALKAYEAGGSDPHAGPDGLSWRLRREVAALRFLADQGETRVPRVVAASPARRLALFTWIDGAPAGRDAASRQPGDLSALSDFALRLHTLRDAPAAADLGEAAEACLSATALLTQLERRLVPLRPLTGEPDLTALLDTRLRPALARATDRLHALHAANGWDMNAALPPAARTLSPSDFGFHNAVRGGDGALVFLDFEYFGWDDPVKLTADTLWHPGHLLSPPERAAWLAAYGDAARHDPAFAARLSAHLPLYGLRWSLILLNEFLPDRWRRRVFAGQAPDWAAAKTRQLHKAHLWLDAVDRLLAAPTVSTPTAPLASLFPDLMRPVP